jgi:hypothetical protein
LAPLSACRYVFRLTPTAPLALPLYGRGGVLRGGFGLAFRRRVCHDLDLVCRACPKHAHCAYPDVFESAPPPGSQRLRTFTDIPRPFAFDPPDDPRTLFNPGDELRFGLVVVGRANARLPHFVAAFRDLARTGLGPRRGGFELLAVEAEAADGSLRAVAAESDGGEAPQLRAGDLLRPGDAARASVTLRFETPLDLRDGGRVVERPAFGALIRRLRDRAAALAAFFGERPLELDFRSLGERAESVRLAHDRTRRVQVSRLSTRTQARHDIGGLVGEACYEGAAVGALMPLVRLGELIHAGRHAAFGNGRLRVVG